MARPCREGQERDRVLFGLPFEVGDDVALAGPFGGGQDGVLEHRGPLVGHARLAPFKYPAWDRLVETCYHLLF